VHGGRYLLSLFILRTLPTTLFPYTTLFRSVSTVGLRSSSTSPVCSARPAACPAASSTAAAPPPMCRPRTLIRRAMRRLLRNPSRSEEHTSELQSREKLVCRLLLEKKKEEPKIQPVRQLPPVGRIALRALKYIRLHLARATGRSHLLHVQLQLRT